MELATLFAPKQTGMFSHGVIFLIQYENATVMALLLVTANV
jgi:hypothetical protein